MRTPCSCASRRASGVATYAVSARVLGAEHVGFDDPPLRAAAAQAAELDAHRSRARIRARGDTNNLPPELAAAAARSTTALLTDGGVAPSATGRDGVQLAGDGAASWTRRCLRWHPPISAISVLTATVVPAARRCAAARHVDRRRHFLGALVHLDRQQWLVLLDRVALIL